MLLVSDLLGLLQNIITPVIQRDHGDLSNNTRKLSKIAEPIRSEESLSLSLDQLCKVVEAWNNERWTDSSMQGFMLFLFKPIKLTATDDSNRNEFKYPYSQMLHKEVPFVDLAPLYKKVTYHSMETGGQCKVHLCVIKD